MPIMNLEISNVLCTNIQIGEKSKTGMYRTTIHLGTHSNLYDRLVTRLEHMYGDVKIIASNDSVSETSSTMWADGDAVLVDTSDGAITLNVALERGSRFVGHMSVFINDVNINTVMQRSADMNVPGRDTIYKFSIGKVNPRFDGNITLHYV